MGETNNETRTAEARSQKKARSAGRGIPDPCVYCGPSVRGVAQQYTVYHGGLPEALAQRAETSAALRGLLVGLDRFPAVRRALERSGSAEAAWYRRLKQELEGV